MRVHELAKELGVTSKELLAALEQMGVTGKSASSSVPEDIVPRLRASGGKATTAPAKSREVLEPPPQPRKPRAKPKAKAAAAAGRAGAPRRRGRRAGRRGARRRRGAQAAPSSGGAPSPRPRSRRAPCCRSIHGATPQMIAEKTRPVARRRS